MYTFMELQFPYLVIWIPFVFDLTMNDAMAMGDLKTRLRSAGYASIHKALQGNQFPKLVIWFPVLFASPL